MMCQATVYLDGKEILRDVMIVEPVAGGIRLIALFEPVQVVPACIRQIDLIKHRVILETLQEDEVSFEQGGESASSKSV